MYIKVVSKYPHHLASEVGKVYVEAMKAVPDDRSITKPVVQAAVEAVDGNFLVTHFAVIKPGKHQEAFDRASERMLHFAKLQGFGYTITFAYQVGEAMKFIGMESPV